MIIIFFLLGLVFGSFANVCIYRLPKGKSLIAPGSQCPACGKPILWWDNIPLLSYLLLKAKCRFCKAPISPRYFIVELVTGGLFLILAGRFTMLSPVFTPLVLTIYLVFALALVIISFIDLDTFFIPVVIVRPLIVVGLAAAFFAPGMFVDLAGWRSGLYSLAGIVAGGGVLALIAAGGKLWYKKDAMGWGDVELLAMIGAFVGYKGVFMTMLFGALLGSVVSIILIALKKKTKEDYVPFGPYLSLGALITVLWKGYIFSAWLVQ